MRLLLLAALLTSTLALAGDRPIKAIPALTRAPKLDGNMKDMATGYALKPVDADTATAGFVGRIAYRKDQVFVAVEITDDTVLAGDIATLTLFFPGAGATARGYSFRFAPDGKRTSDPDSLTPAFVQSKVEGVVTATEKGLVIKALIPAMALPRWPSTDPMELDVCVTYEDRDEMAQPPKSISNCKGGAMAEGVKLPDAFRKELKLKLPERVVAVEGTEVGWVGFGVLPQATWIYSDAAVTLDTLKALHGNDAVDPTRARINVPKELDVEGKPVIGIVTGKDPYAVDGQCNGEHELRIGLYRVSGRTADKVLDWPASTCQLGRATSISVDEDGTLTFGYTNGAIQTFSWTTDHFERTEIGSR